MVRFREAVFAATAAVQEGRKQWKQQQQQWKQQEEEKKKKENDEQYQDKQRALIKQLFPV